MFNSQFSYVFPVILSSTIMLVTAQPHAAFGLSAAEVGQIAKGVAVRIGRIDNQASFGSGVIIKQENNTYTILTAAHVVPTVDKYEVITSDDKRYPVTYSTVKQLSGVDLAILKFTSSQSYNVVKIGDSTKVMAGNPCYVSGFPLKSKAITEVIYNFTQGQVTANASRPLRDGYALVYTNPTLPGMSGGPVLNEQGLLIGIHGRADTTDSPQNPQLNPDIYVKTGFNLGIPINTFLSLAAKTEVVGFAPPVTTPVSTTPTADDFFLQAGTKSNNRDDQGAVKDLDQAIRLNPNYAAAYNNRAVARAQKGDNQGAISDYNQAIRLNPNVSITYSNRGQTRGNLGDYQGEVADYDQAIRLDPQNFFAYARRGVARQDMGDRQGAIADYDQAIRLNPNVAIVYSNRAAARSKLGNRQGAIDDANQAIRLDPNNASKAYQTRGIARAYMGDKQGAVADLDQAIRLNPNNVEAYTSRGAIRSELGDKQGGIADHGEAIRLNPSNASAYYNRAVARFNVGDRQGAIADFQKAADLSRAQGNVEMYQRIMNNLQKF